MKCAVIGGGIGGLTGALTLAQASHTVTLFEATSSLGGVAAAVHVPGGRVDGTYHHIFLQDDRIVELIDRMDLRQYLHWQPSRMGFFDGAIHPFSSPMDLIRYSPLSFTDRIRFGLSTWYFQFRRQWQDLETVSAKEWIETWCSPTLYRKIWRPLLVSKFGEGEADHVSAAWLWGRIHPRARSRQNGDERLGYLEGTFQRLFDAMAERLKDHDCRIQLQTPVLKVTREGDRYAITTHFGIESGFDRILCTLAPPQVARIFPDMPSRFLEKMNAIRYRGCLCLILVHTRPLSGIYWLNIADPSIPFGGIIEQTNFMDLSYYEGHCISYIFNYLDQNHRYFQLSEQQLFQEYWPSLKKIYPELLLETISFVRKFQVRWACPLYTGAYSTQIPPQETPWPGVMLANMAHIYPEDRNMTNSVTVAERVAKKLADRS